MRPLGVLLVLCVLAGVARNTYRSGLQETATNHPATSTEKILSPNQPISARPQDRSDLLTSRSLTIGSQIPKNQKNELPRVKKHNVLDADKLRRRGTNRWPNDLENQPTTSSRIPGQVAADSGSSVANNGLENSRFENTAPIGTVPGSADARHSMKN